MAFWELHCADGMIENASCRWHYEDASCRWHYGRCIVPMALWKMHRADGTMNMHRDDGIMKMRTMHRSDGIMEGAIGEIRLEGASDKADSWNESSCPELSSDAPHPSKIPKTLHQWFNSGISDVTFTFPGLAIDCLLPAMNVTPMTTYTEFISL